MRQSDHLRTEIETLFAECLAITPKSTLKCLMKFVFGALVSQALMLRQIATTLTHVFGDTVQAVSHERRLRHTLNETDVQAVSTYSRVVRRILRRLRPDQHLRIIIDESGHSDVVRVLTVGLWYRGRVLPLTWVSWEGQKPHKEIQNNRIYVLSAPKPTRGEGSAVVPTARFPHPRPFCHTTLYPHLGNLRMAQPEGVQIFVQMDI